MRTNLLRVITVLALTALPLSACTVTGEPSDPAPKATQADPGTEEDMPLETVEPEPEETEPAFETGVFGGNGFTWDDGIKVVIGKPKEFTPSEYAMFEPANKYIVFEITLTNGTDQPFDPTMVYVTGSSGGQEAVEVYDSDGDMKASPSTRVLPGKSVTWDIAFGVETAKDTVLEVTPDFDHAPALFVAEGGDTV